MYQVQSPPGGSARDGLCWHTRREDMPLVRGVVVMLKIKYCMSHKSYCNARIRQGRFSLCCRHGWCEYAQPSQDRGNKPICTSRGGRMICPKCGSRDVLHSSDWGKRKVYSECQHCLYDWEEDYDPNNLSAKEKIREGIDAENTCPGL